MSDPFAAAVAAALFAEASKGPLLWSGVDGTRCYGRDTGEGCELEVIGDDATVITRITGVRLSAVT